jgi:hypothetical protein
MKTINLRRNSWHYWLAKDVASWNHIDNDDFCSYVRAVIAGAVLISIVSVIVSVVGGGSVVGAGVALYCWWHHVNLNTLSPILGFSAACFATVSIGAAVIGIVYLFLTLKKHAKEKLHHKAGTKPDSFIRSAYVSFKDKVCFRVKLN